MEYNVLAARIDVPLYHASDFPMIDLFSAIPSYHILLHINLIHELAGMILMVLMRMRAWIQLLRLRDRKPLIAVCEGMGME